MEPQGTSDPKRDADSDAEAIASLTTEVARLKACCRPHCLHTERQLSLEMVRQRSMVMVIDSLG